LALPEELNRLLEAGVHFGHRAKRWNPKMEKFIFGKRSGIYIIDLEKTLEKIREAQEFLKNLVKEEKDILFVGTKKQAQGVIKEIAQACNMPYVVDRWVGGLLTNFKVVSSRIERYKKLLKDRESGNFEKLLKKEVVMLNKEIEKMEKNFVGVKNMENMPAALLVVDPKKEILAVKEAIKVGIPVVALIDTDSDPDIIDYPMPGNDDALKSIKTVLSFVMDAIGEILTEKENKAVEKEQAEEKEAAGEAEITVEELPEEYEHVEEKVLKEKDKEEGKRPKKAEPRGTKGSIRRTRKGKEDAAK